MSLSSFASLVAFGLVLLGAAIVQVGVVPAIFLDAFGAPVLPVAVLAAWAASRGVETTWAWAVPLALLLGSVSEMRAGWFVLALIPTPLLVAAIRARTPTIPTTMLAAAGGAVAYVSTLTLAANRLPLLSSALDATMRGAVLTALAGLVVAVALVPLRPRERGLFRS